MSPKLNGGSKWARRGRGGDSWDSSKSDDVGLDMFDRRTWRDELAKRELLLYRGGEADLVEGALVLDGDKSLDEVVWFCGEFGRRVILSLNDGNAFKGTLGERLRALYLVEGPSLGETCSMSLVRYELTEPASVIRSRDKETVAFGISSINPSWHCGQTKSYNFRLIVILSKTKQWKTYRIIGFPPLVTAFVAIKLKCTCCCHCLTRALNLQIKKLFYNWGGLTREAKVEMRSENLNLT